MRNFLLTFWVFLHCSVILHADDFRTWTSRSGKKQIEAKLVEVEESRVQLERRDGTTLWVEIANLSEADIASISDRHSAKDDGDAKLEAKRVNQDKVAPQPLIHPLAKASDKPFVIEKRILSQYVLPCLPSIWMGMDTLGDGKVKNGEARRLDIYNLLIKKKIRTVVLPNQEIKFSLTPDGARCAIALSTGKTCRLLDVTTGNDICTVSPQGKPNESLWIFPNNSLLLGIKKLSEEVEVFDAKSGESLRTVPIKKISQLRVAVSPDGRQIAYPSAESIELFDIEASEQKGTFPIEGKGTIAAICYSQHSNEICYILNDRQKFSFVAYSLTEQKNVHTASLPTIGFVGSSSIGKLEIDELPSRSGWCIAGMHYLPRNGKRLLDIDKPESLVSALMLVTENKQLVHTDEDSKMAIGFRKIIWPKPAIQDILDSPKLQTATAKSDRPKEQPTGDLESPAPTVVGDFDFNRLYTTTSLPNKAWKPAQELKLPALPPGSKTLFFPTQSDGTCLVGAYLQPKANTLPSSSHQSLYLANFQKGKLESTKPRELNGELGDISPENKWIAYSDDGRPNEVLIEDLKTGKGQVSIQPSKETDVRFTLDAKFLGPKQLLIRRNEPVVWQVPECEPLYELKGGSHFAPIPGGEEFAELRDNHVLIRRLKDASFVGALQFDPNMPANANNASITVSADRSNCTLAVREQACFYVSRWDLNTGKLAYSAAIPNYNCQFIAPFTNKYVLLSGSAVEGFMLYDLEERKVDWLVKQDSVFVQKSPSGILFGGNSLPNTPSSIRSFTIPSPLMLKVQKQSKSASAFKMQGESVAFEIDTSIDSKVNESVTADVRRIFAEESEKYGVMVNNNSKNIIRASIQQGSRMLASGRTQQYFSVQSTLNFGKNPPYAIHELAGFHERQPDGKVDEPAREKAIESTKDWIRMNLVGRLLAPRDHVEGHDGLLVHSSGEQLQQPVPTIRLRPQ